MLHLPGIFIICISTFARMLLTLKMAHHHGLNASPCVVFDMSLTFPQMKGI